MLPSMGTEHAVSGELQAGNPYTPEKNFTLSESGKKQWKKITELTQGKWLEKTKHYFTKLKKFLPY